MKRVFPLLAVACAAALAAAPARAGEIFGGLYKHDVSIVAARHMEQGVDFELGWRGPKILRALGGPQPHVLMSLNSAGDTHFAAAGISWRIDNPVYIRPGVGIAIHTGPNHFSADRISFGSRVLFEPELGIGARLTQSASIEASWVHLSHAYLFGPQNPGLDTIGLRFNYRFR